MAVIHIVRRSDSSPQSFLQHGYFIAAAVIIVVLVILRIFVLRWRNQRVHDFFRIGNRSQYAHGSQLPHNSNDNSGYHGVQLTPLPAAYRLDRSVRAVDTDAFGRRLGAVEEGGGKDALPAYDSLGRPPKYIEAGWSHGELPQSAVVPSPEGEQGRMGHRTLTNGIAGDNADQQLDDTHAVAGIATHHDLSNR